LKKIDNMSFKYINPIIPPEVKEIVVFKKNPVNKFLLGLNVILIIIIIVAFI